MLVSGINVLRERSMTETALGVDSDNPTGAMKLYESVGFRVIKTDTVFQKPL